MSRTSGKKHSKALESVVKGQTRPVADALAKVKELSHVTFDESVDVSVNLGIDPSKGDQVVRGAVTLPHGRGKKVVVIVFAKGDYVDQAKTAGADHVGLEDLIEKINKGWLKFDFAVATPDVMGQVGKLAKVLGPRGLLPNKKVGTVTFDVASVVAELKKGKMFFRNDKQGLVHFAFGRVSFEKQALLENLKAFVKALVAAKPASSKGVYLKKMTVSSTMGVGLSVNPEDVLRS